MDLVEPWVMGLFCINSIEFKSYSFDSEIESQTLYAYTPEIKGVAECKIKYLSEVIRALLIEMNI